VILKIVNVLPIDNLKGDITESAHSHLNI